MNSEEWIHGGGALAELIRTHDWAKTPIGALADWPQSLKTVVRVMLTSRFAMWLGWGPELTFLYNDAYAEMTLGKKHPWALGRPSRQVWEEIWDDIGPRIQKVLDTGEATWDEALLLFLERSGYREETYHTFSYSPLAGDDGKIAGHFCVVTEETERVIGQRRLNTLQSLAAELSKANTEADVMSSIANTLGANGHDLPFTLLYTFNTERTEARLACRTGIEASHAAAPERIELADRNQAWPLGDLLTRKHPVKDSFRVGNLAARFDAVPCGVWNRPPTDALLVPITSQGHDKPTGIIITGLNPYRQLEADYRGYLELIAGQIAGSIANARAFEHERKRSQALAEIDQAKTMFFSNVSHEFRTPLTLMLGPIHDLLSRSNIHLSPMAKEQLELANRNGGRLLRLVNTLLDFSRIEAGRIEAVYQATDLARFTADLASVFRAATDRAGLKLLVDCAALDSVAYVDNDMWEKIVLNLISNAFKFTFEGEIAVSLKQVEDSAQLRVRDTGIGIPAAEIPRLFERFYRVPNTRSRTYEGTGIGLSLVHELVKLHGGSIQVESTPLKGSTFIVTVPLGQNHLAGRQIGGNRSLASTAIGPSAFVEEALRWLPDVDGPPSEVTTDYELETATVRDAAPGPIARPHVLVVDDNADMRLYIGHLLSGLYEVKYAANGKLALEAIRREPPDLVVSDAMMPELDGFGLLRELRADESTTTIPIILLSGRAGEESRVEGLAAGADDFLVKPFSARELSACVAAHLNVARLKAVSEARINRLLNTMSDGCHIIDKNWRFTTFNAAAREMFKKRGINADVLLGQHIFEEAFPQARDSAVYRVFERTMKERIATTIESFYPRWQCWYLMRNYPTEKGGVATFWQDITEQKRAPALLLELQQILELIGRGCSLDEGLTSVIQMVTRLRPGARAAVLVADEARARMRAVFPATTPSDMGKGIRGMPINDALVGTCSTAIYRGEAVVCSDIANDHRWSEPWRELCLDHDIRACHSTPILDAGGTAIASFAIFYDEPHEPDEWERGIGKLGARIAGIAMERDLTEQAG